MTRGFTFFLVLFAIFVLSGVACATQGSLELGRALVSAGMFFGTLALICEISVAIERWRTNRNRPRILI